MPTIQNYLSRLCDNGATISAGQTVSNIVNVYGASLLALIIPAGFTSATLTFNASMDGINFYSMVDAYTGNPIQLVSSASTFARIFPTDFVGVQAFKIVSSVTQASEVNIDVVCGPLL
jgi:hypothetical protein